MATDVLPQNALRRDYTGKSIERIEGNYLEVVVEVYFLHFFCFRIYNK